MHPTRRAFVMVWDGLRPDFISRELTPHLSRVAERGVRFADSHAVFPTVTRCNSASISTGALPANHGIPGNALYARDVDQSGPLNTGDHRALEALRRTRGGRVLLRRTLAEHVAQARGNAVIVGTGSPGSSLLQHPQVEECGDVLLNPALTVGHDRAALEATFGPIPARSVPCTELNAYFTRVITEFVLPELQPRLLTLWHTDPDGAQHQRGAGHPDALEAIRDADRNLGAILDTFERLGIESETDVVVTSDHGFSTIGDRVDIGAALIEAGVKQSRDSADVVVAEGMIYVPSGDAATVRRIVELLQRLEAVGPVFTRTLGAPLAPGTLPLSAAGAGGEFAPDVLFSLNWSDDENEHGVPGTCWASPSNYRGMHGSLSPWEVRNTLVAAGPDFKQGVVSDVPAGVVDIAPTLLRALALDAAQPLDGRVLEEALVDGPDPASLSVQRETLTAEAPGFAQELQTSTVRGARYVDLGRVERA